MSGVDKRNSVSDIRMGWFLLSQKQQNTHITLFTVQHNAMHLNYLLWAGCKIKV